MIFHNYYAKVSNNILVYFTTPVPDTNDTSATRVKNFDFNNDTRENIFSHPYISFIANEISQGEEQFHSKN